MASGHVNRANRPNTWLHRPRLRREDSPCQLGAVHTWHKADITIVLNASDNLPLSRPIFFFTDTSLTLLFASCAGD
jgi:hypothetical protein